MTITRELQIALYQHTAAIENARADYYAHPSEFNKRQYCSRCSRLPRMKNGCEQCEARLRMRKLRAA